MANIVTVFVRIEHVKYSRALSDARIVALLTRDYGRCSYCVPLWLARRDRFTDVQFGARWSAGTGVERLWSALDGQAESLWIRAYDSGGDFDEIFAWDRAGPSPRRECRYAFDAVVWTPRDGAPERRVVWGSYAAGNHRAPLDDAPFVPTLTTPAARGASAGDTLPVSLAGEIAAARPSLASVDYFFEGRRVRHEVRDPGGAWSHYALDDWDNCADGAYEIAFGRSPAPTR